MQDVFFLAVCVYRYTHGAVFVCLAARGQALGASSLHTLWGIGTGLRLSE